MVNHEVCAEKGYCNFAYRLVFDWVCLLPKLPAPPSARHPQKGKIVNRPAQMFAIQLACQGLVGCVLTRDTPTFCAG
jgi:hypothetical protein